MSFGNLSVSSAVVHLAVFLVFSRLLHVQSWTSAHLKPWTSQDVITLCSSHSCLTDPNSLYCGKTSEVVPNFPFPPSSSPSPPSPHAAAARGDAQESFDRKLSHYRNEIPDLRNRRAFTIDLLFRRLTCDHPAVTRTLQYATDIASSRNGQQTPAKSLQCRWKHEIQIALLRRRAAVTWAVLPNPSARTEWLLACIIDRALHRWGHVPPLDGGPGDHDHADSETDTAIPDDDDDIQSIVRILAAISSLSAWFWLPRLAPPPCGEFSR